MASSKRAKMEFTTESKDYSVPEFYDVFATQLPKIVMVNQGFYGDISADTFDRGQILRLHMTSQQSRVIAKTEYQRQTKFYSIPLTYQSNFCVVNKNGKAGKEQPLSQIIRDNCLPIHVQFPKNKCIDVGNHTVHTSSLPSLEICRVFSEVYILGNFIVDGVMAQEIVHLPLYLSQMRLALVTGIEGQNSAKWKSYQEELNHSTLHLEFDKEFGNPDIAEYQPSEIERITDDADLVYAKIEPSLYTNIPVIFRAGIKPSPGTPKTGAKREDPNVYETISQTDSGQSAYQMLTFKSSLESALDKKTGNNPQPRRAPPVLPKPVKDDPTLTKDTGSFCPPSVPKRDYKTAPPIKTNQQLKENVYMNKVGQVTPVVKQQTDASKPCVKPFPQQHTGQTGSDSTPPPSSKDVLPVVKKKPISTENKTVNVEELSIEDVCTYLGALKLEKYVETFRENMIDGKLLKELDKDVLKTDFMMNNLEAIRLMKFIQEGHIPM